MSVVQPVKPWFLASAATGAALWALTLALVQPSWGAALLLLAPLVLVPLGLALLLSEPLSILDKAIRALQFPAALLVLAAVALPQGLLAASLSMPWLLLTGLVALLGILRLWKWPVHFDEASKSMAMIFLAVGGGWLVLSRAGLRPLEFRDVIVQATAIHFHYAGFVLPLLMGLLIQRQNNRLTRALAGCVVAGVPLVAMGITLSAFGVRWLEWLAAWFLAGTCMLVGILQLWLALTARRRVSQILFLGSGLAIIAGMVLAAVYALGVLLDRNWLDIPQMQRWHGSLNAFGFALLGLLAWTVETRSNAPPPLQERPGSTARRASLVLPADAW